MIKKAPAPNSYILFEGPSQYDPSVNVVVIATGLATPSSNTKTGGQIQTFILRQDIAPHLAIKTGDDSAVCGKCPLRPVNKANGLGKPCYVKTFQAPLSVWKAYHRGIYPVISLASFREMLQGGSLRMGSYGDPASIPFEIWEAIGVGSGEFRHTSYTHGYLMPGFDARFLDVSMISLDPISEKLPNLPVGRTFRAIAKVQDLRPDEILCPGSQEGGFRTTCKKCGLCKGLARKAKNIAVLMH